MTLLEIAVQDVAGARVAVAGGADRLELCAALPETGGLTPSIGLLAEVVAAVPATVGVHVLVRSRPGGFTYTADELAVQVSDVRAAVAAGAAGVVVGALRATAPWTAPPWAPWSRPPTGARSRSTARSTPCRT